MNKFDVKFVTTKKICLTCLFRPTFKREKQFRNGVIAIEEEKCEVILNKAIYIGVTILDLRKILMLDFYYNCIKNKFVDKAEIFLRYTDLY